jgi:hypothetical protein
MRARRDSTLWERADIDSLHRAACRHDCAASHRHRSSYVGGVAKARYENENRRGRLKPGRTREYLESSISVSHIDQGCGIGAHGPSVDQAKKDERRS